jgi:hypothetical protein
VKKLTYGQQKIIDLIYQSNMVGKELRHSEAGINFDQRSANALLKKGLIKSEIRSRLRTDDMDMVYWSVYILVNPVMRELE